MAARDSVLFFLFTMHRVFSKTGTELLQLEFFATRFSPERVVIVARFFAHQEDNFHFLFAFSTLFLRHVDSRTVC